MPLAPEITERAQDIAFRLGAQFPDLNASDLKVIKEHDAELIRVEWDGWTALVPESEAAQQQLATMAAVMPHLRGFLSPSVPLWEHSSERGDWQHDWRAARRLEARPLRPELIVEQNRERLVRDLATFFHELHGFSVERARGLGAPSAHEWRERHETLSRRALSTLRPLVSWSRMTWARRWWSRFLDDEASWKGRPALVHGGIAEQRLRVDPLVQQLSAVTGWHGLRVADPAVDFAHLVDAYGAELGWRIIEQYGELGSTADAALFRRVRLQQTVSRFRELVNAVERDGADSESVQEALKRLN